MQGSYRVSLDEVLAVSKPVVPEQKAGSQHFAVVWTLNCHYSVSMARKDRLFSLIQILRDGNLYRACDLAELVGVSLRTLYRDMDTLAASGVPIRGERGLGYQITAAYTLPALNLTKTELEALHLGLAAVGESEDAELSAAAKALSRRIDGVLPEDSAAGLGLVLCHLPFRRCRPRLSAYAKTQTGHSFETVDADYDWLPNTAIATFGAGLLGAAVDPSRLV
jgi:biotin operon repressor